MLQFFRKHQKYFFILITVVVVTSFVFFGTYQAFAPSPRTQKGEEVLFHTCDGRPITTSYLEQVTLFLEQEEGMPLLQWHENNYLNDGFLTREFLESGCALTLIPLCEAASREALLPSLAREKGYVPYQHPSRGELSALQVWSLFAPDLPRHLAALQASDDPIASFPDRIALFLAERHFPSSLLTQVLRYQERELPPEGRDPRLGKGSLSLFGYRTHRDWFGRPFTQQVAKVVIQGAAVARTKGYTLSAREAHTELLRKSTAYYDALAGRVSLPVEDGRQLLQLYLKQRGMREETLVALWQDLSLFRRMMEEVGRVPLLDTLAVDAFSQYAYQEATVQLYQMAPELRLTSERDARLFDGYLQAVASVDETGAIPLDYAPLAAIEARAPELVGRHYTLLLRSCALPTLYAKVGVKEMWEWEAAHLADLSTLFPALPQRGEGEDPYTYLHRLPSRDQIDTYARAEIVRAHPEWIQEALRETEAVEKVLYLSEARIREGAAASKELLPGVTDGARLAALLEQGEVEEMTQDQKHYYAFTCIGRSEEKEVLSFKEARALGLLQERAGTPWSFADYLAAYYRSPPQGALARQWVVETREVKVSRATETWITREEVASLEEGACSAVRVDPYEGPYCYIVKTQGEAAPLSLQKWFELQEWGAREVRHHFFSALLTRLSGCL